MPAPAPPPVGAWLVDDDVRFRVWAPDATRVLVELTDASGGPSDELPLSPDPADPGMWEVRVGRAGIDTRYRYRLDDGSALPDPASLSQPAGVHGPSAVVAPDFAWTDDAFVAPSLADSVFYELHVGTFTVEGTFDAAAQHLARLAELGVTTIELLPIAEFPGGRNWGYDGVFPFAAQSTYGGLDGLRRLVDAAHGAGLAVCLDVVHNHLGPEGNVLGSYGPYFTDRYQTPWGAALNFDGAGSDHVRQFFLESADFFAAHAHVDAFRLDAVHAIVDNSAYPYVEELTAALQRRGWERGRSVLVVAESAADDPRLVRPTDAGGWGLDSQWNDDFHHSLHVALTGERDGYYADYEGGADLAQAMTAGFTHRGRFSTARGHRLGHPTLRVPPERLVVFSANHDQIGNRLAGDRLTTQVDAERAKVAAAAVLLSPSIPLLFMGDEHGETAPFPYFVSHTDPALVAAVRAGRAAEFAAFSQDREPPDPQSEDTFRSAILDHDAARTEPGTTRWHLHQTLIALRRAHRPQVGQVGVRPGPGPGSLLVFWSDRPELGALVLVLALGDGETRVGAADVTDVTDADDEATGWEVAIDTADPQWGGPGPSAHRHDDGSWSITGPAVVLLVRR